MADKKAGKPATAGNQSALPSPHSRREELLDALLVHTLNSTHSRILGAYKNSGTVQSAEQEFVGIILAIIDEA